MKTSQISHLPASQIDAAYAKEVANNDALLKENTQLKQQLAWFKRQIYGRKSEKILIDNPDQGNLFAIEKMEPSSAPIQQSIKAHSRNIKHKSDNDVNDAGLRFSDDVPKQIIEMPCPELEGKDADKFEVIGTKDTHRLAQQIGSYVVLVYRRKVVKLKETNHDGLHTIITTPAPNNVLDGCYADVSLLAGLMVDKAVYHLPLNRQHRRMLDAGVTLSRSTLLNYVSRGIDLLKPIAKAMLKNMLAGQHLAMDEVPHKVGRKPVKGSMHKQMKQTYFWPIYGQNDEVYFTWSSNRSAQHAIDQLKGFKGTLLTDGYAAYTTTVSQLNQQTSAIIHANCWAHCRRMFERALDNAPNETKHALDIIRQLYQVEKHLKKNNVNGDDITYYRQQYSKPIIDDFFDWLHEQRQRLDLLPKDPFTKAILYAHERENSLRVYLTHPQVPIDTNHLERSLRVIPMGRKNHLFCWTELGAEQLGVLHSLTVTCRLHNINPYTYLVDVLQRISQHPAKDIVDLTPRRWKALFGDNPLTSDVNVTKTPKKQKELAA